MPELAVIAHQLLAPIPGGTGRYTAELIRALVETAPEGWTVTAVVGRHQNPEPARIAGAGLRVLPLPAKALAVLWQQGARYWPGGDAVHAPIPLAPLRPPRDRSSSVTVSVTVHDTVPWTHPETLTRQGVRWHRAMIAAAAQQATAVVVPTAAVRDELAEYIPVSVPVKVIGHGVTKFPVSASPATAEVEKSLPKRFVLALGTIEPRKGLDVLIEAMALLEKKPLFKREPLLGEVSLLLVGPQGWGKIDPLALARAHGLAAGRVRALGLLSDAELDVVLKASTVLAVPSLAEGFGLPLLEAMNAGVPVVHSQVPALVEVAGGAGISVPPGDPVALAEALSSVFESPALAQTLALKGEARAKQFSWRAAAQELWRIHADDLAHRDAVT